MKIITFIVLGTLFGVSIRADETYQSGSYQVIVSGDFNHSKPQKGVIIGAPDGETSAFRQEIFGNQFTLSVPDLDSGKYQVVLGFDENFADHPGVRTFDISYGGQIMVSNLDIYAVAGGRKKVCFLTNNLDFVRGAINQPLTLAFTARENKAKLNTFELRDAAGRSLIFLRAQDLVPGLAGIDPAALKIPEVSGPEIWKDPTASVDARVRDLVSRLSLVEKVSQLRCDAVAIPRLGIPAYSYRNEGLHGVANTGPATSFPQAIGMAATWDAPLIQQEADVIATEARAEHNQYAAEHHGNSAVHFGLSFYAPNINICRDPRWGRTQETYGEDPFLTGQIGVAFIRGLQGDDPKYFKVIAGAKHFAVHSGPEPERHEINMAPPERDLYETYLPAFEAAVREGHVDSVMGAYSALYGLPDCANPFLLTDVLRGRWGFKGYVVSDGGAIADINVHHKFVPTAEQAAAVAVNAGDDMCSGGGNEYGALTAAVKEGLISETTIDTALSRSLEARFRLGLFDPPSMVPYAGITIAQNDTPEHRALALKVAQESIVLMKNNGLLPLDRAKIKRLAVIGANAEAAHMLLGNYEGRPTHIVTILDGIREAAGTNMEVVYEKGAPLATKNDNSNLPDPETTARAVAAAQSADAVIYVGGLDSTLECEQAKVNYQGFLGGDRTRIELPAVQEELLQKLQATGKPVVFVNCSGSAMAIPWETKHLPAIVQAWYPGEEGGQAVADVLFGAVNPAGRLPVTFYRSTADLPDFKNYSMTNRTYRYFEGRPLFAFGHGLSYTRFKYGGMELKQSDLAPGDTVQVSFTVKNTGARDGDEVPQVYFRHLDSAVPQPKLALCGFTRIHVARGQTENVTLEIPAERLRYWDTKQKEYVVEPGRYELLVGAASDDIRLKKVFKIGVSSL
jgi:beta-glucosidase